MNMRVPDNGKLCCLTCTVVINKDLCSKDVHSAEETLEAVDIYCTIYRT